MYMFRFSFYVFIFIYGFLDIVSSQEKEEMKDNGALRALIRGMVLFGLTKGYRASLRYYFTQCSPFLLHVLLSVSACVFLRFSVYGSIDL